MKKLVFDYEMKLSFSSPVTDHRFQLRCIPATGPRQQVIDVAVKIEPDVELETTIDSFDSVVMTGFIPEPHTMFNYSVTGIASWTTRISKPKSTSRCTASIRR